MEELAMNNTAIQTAMDAASIFMQNSTERLAYLNREMAILDYESDKAAWMEEGRNAGRVEGRAEGRTEGRTEGKAEGRAEERAAGIKSFVTSAKELGASPEQTAAQLMKNYSLSKNEAQASVLENW